MKTYAVIIPYYGCWPVYFPLFLKGVECNPQLKVILITDLPMPKLPENVTLLKQPLQELKRRAEEVLQVPICLERPFKLCDLKPMYGLIFQEELAGVDYWGHGDVDLIFGNLDIVVQPLMEQEYDVISFDKYWLSGPFCLYRNTEKCNNLFRRSPDWERVLQISRCVAFDECAELWPILRQGVPVETVPAPFQAMTQICFPAADRGEISCYHENHLKEEFERKSEFCTYERGNFTCNGKNIFIYHFILAKSRWYFFFPRWNEVPDKFYITRTGFYTERALAWLWLIALVRYFFSLFRFIEMCREDIRERGFSAFFTRCYTAAKRVLKRRR